MRTQPNILLLFSDQHNAGTLSCAGHPDVTTPHLDRLAASGVRFNRAYCQDGVCVASRASLFTGQYPRALGCLDNGDRSVAMEEAISLPRVLQTCGYRTAAFGKRHLYLGCDDGWHIRAGHQIVESPDDNYVDWLRAQGQIAAFSRDWAAEFGCGPDGTPEHGQDIPFALLSARASQLPEDCTMEAWTKRRTIEFLRTRRQGDPPFFCFASFYRPHQPYTPLPRYFERFDRRQWGRGTRHGDVLAMPASLRQPVAELPPVFQEWHAGTNRIWRLDLARQDEQLYRDAIAAYYALVMEIDDHIGDILRVLEETGQRENTIVIYASDHGDFVGAHGMVEKCSVGHNIYEDTLRVPLLISWPGRIAPRRTPDDLVELVDLFPTVMELCGAPAAAVPGLQGASLAPYLLRDQPVGKPWLVSENWSQTTVITPRYKLGVWNDVSQSRPQQDYRAFGPMLFDMATDPLELRNCWSELPEVREQLSQYLEAWRKRQPDVPVPPVAPALP